MKCQHLSSRMGLLAVVLLAACGSSGNSGTDPADAPDVPADVAPDAVEAGDESPDPGPLPDAVLADDADVLAPDVPADLPADPDVADAVEPDAAGTDLASPPDVPMCGPGTCPGCCDGNTCIEGTGDEHCGTAGGACVACPNGATCVDGECAVLPACNPVLCLGCCDGDICHPGNLPAACGKDGAACTACEGEAACGDGECAVPPACTPATCTGCCDGTVCVDGTADGACGTQGNACQACEIAAGATCQDGLCLPPCGPSNCAGCCYEGLCLPGLGTSWACGHGGLVCDDCGELACTDGECAECAGGVDCSTAGGKCVYGKCVDATCADSCDGCCLGSECLPGDSDAACGVLGESCFACPQNQVCSRGEYPPHARCLVDPVSRWDLIVVGAEFAATKCNDQSWDSFGGLPDPVVLAEGEWGKGISGHTSKVDDSLAPTWNEAVLADFSAGDFLGWGCLTAEDRDVALGDKLCGHCITTAEANAYQLWNDPAVWDGQIHTFVLADECSASVPLRGCKLSVRFVPR